MEQVAAKTKAGQASPAGTFSMKLGKTTYDIAEQTGTITNEILSRLGSRLDRFII